MVNERPIEGHLAALGLDPRQLTDDDRRVIAVVIVDAVAAGNGYLRYWIDSSERRHQFQRQDPLTTS